MTNHGKGGVSRNIPIIEGAENPNFSKVAGTSYEGSLRHELVDLGGYRPLHDVVIVQFQQPPEKSEGGVILPDSAQRRPEEGVVVAVGPGNVAWSGTSIPVGCKRGDRVRFQPQAFGNQVRFPGIQPWQKGGPMLLEMRETDILGVWPAESAS